MRFYFFLGVALLLSLLAGWTLSKKEKVAVSSTEETTAFKNVQDSLPLQLAITLDDLPWVGPLPQGDSTADQALGRIAAILRVHQAPATGFVVCNNAQNEEAPLQTWAAWGYTLGNHSAAHRDLNRTPVEEWLADVSSCEDYLQRFGDAHIPYFRFPLLHQGNTAEKRARVQAALAEMGLRTAHVTVDNSEWILTRAHAYALNKGDAGLRRDIGREFIRHITAALEHADEVARRKLGRSVPHVLLLHANSLVEDYLDELLLELSGRGVEFISLEKAQADPAYARADEYIGPKGLSWLYRMQPLSAEDVEWDDAEAATIEARFAGALTTSVPARLHSASTDRYVAFKEPPGFADLFAEAATSERMRSLLVMHRGELVAEAYFNGAGPETPINLKSVTKSLVSALVGVALRKGWIESVDDPVSKYLPDRFRDRPEKAGVTIRQLLTMSSGLRPVDYGQVQNSDDWVASVLAQPLDGQDFRYDTPVLQLLTALLAKVSGRSVSELVQQELLKPLGGELVYWRADAQAIELGGNDAYLRPRDLIKLGELYRQGGRFADDELLAEAFVNASTTQQIMPKVNAINHGTLSVRGYGYLWWLLDLNGEEVYAALGHGGQILLVSPERELVLLMASRWPGPSSVAHYRHLTRMIERVLALFPK